MNSESINSEMKTIYNKACSEVDALVGKIRKEIVIPFCRKHNYIFESGNGSWNFDHNTDVDVCELISCLTDPNNPGAYGWMDVGEGFNIKEVEIPWPDGALDIIKVLNSVDLVSGSTVGALMEDITLKDLE
jgi:hypothetical protein